MENRKGSQAGESPFERQLKLGFATLRFQDRLEKVFRQRHGKKIAGLLRVSLVFGLLFVGVQLALDYTLQAPEFQRWSFILGGALMAPALVLALILSLRPQRPGLMAVGSMLVALTLGFATLALDAVAADQGMSSRFAGFLVVTFYMYYLLGLLFWQALFTGLLLAGGFVVGALVTELPMAQLAYNGVFLAFSNLIGLLGLYTLERARRTDFLREGALDFRAGHDGLTGLRNRESFDEKFDIAWRVAKREKKPISVMMIDIDFFKDFNDLYGHQAGDKCLQQVARVMSPIGRRPLDFVGRYGGEEFVIFLSGSIEQYAVEAAEQVRAQVEALRIPHAKSKAAGVVTVSVGLAHLDPGESERSKEGFLQLADEALYRAKERGRNQVLHSQGADKNIQTGFFRREVGGS